MLTELVRIIRSFCIEVSYNVVQLPTYVKYFPQKNKNILDVKIKNCKDALI